MGVRRVLQVFALATLYGASAVQGQAPVRSMPIANNGRLTIDYVFLIDVSGSMAENKPGRGPIFSRVIQTISDYVAQLDAGSTVFVIPFAESVRPTREFIIQNASDINALRSHLGSLTANGQRTAVYDSIRTALTIVQGRSHQNRAVVLHVYTDGEDNVSGLTLGEILETFKLVRSPYDWLFYSELGLPRDAAKQTLFSKYAAENAVYVSETAGEVRPILQVEPLLRFVDFGRVVEGVWPTRVVKFAVRSSRPLPQKLAMSVEPQFDALSTAGVLPLIEPPQFAIDGKEKTLQLKWVNPLPRGRYDGVLKLTTNDPLVVVIPDLLRVTFTHEVPGHLTISPVPGERLPLDLGELQSATSTVRHLSVQFDKEAIDADATVRLDLQEEATNPSRVGVGSSIFVEGAKGKSAVTLDSAARDVKIVVSVPHGLKPGNYGGTLEFSSPALIIIDGKVRGGAGQSVPISWRFSVPEPPMPLWMWLVVGAAVAAVIGFFVFILTRPPRFADLQLQILDPRPGMADLTGQHSKTFGPSTQDLRDAAADFTIRAVKRGRRHGALIETDGAGVKIARRSGKVDVFGSEELFVGDVIEVAPYRLRVESFALGNEDQN